MAKRSDPKGREVRVHTRNAQPGVCVCYVCLCVVRGQTQKLIHDSSSPAEPVSEYLDSITKARLITFGCQPALSHDGASTVCGHGSFDLTPLPAQFVLFEISCPVGNSPCIGTQERMDILAHAPSLVNAP